MLRQVLVMLYIDLWLVTAAVARRYWLAGWAWAVPLRTVAADTGALRGIRQGDVQVQGWRGSCVVAASRLCEVTSPTAGGAPMPAYTVTLRGQAPAPRTPFVVTLRGGRRVTPGGRIRRRRRGGASLDERVWMTWSQLSGKPQAARDAALF